MMFLYMLCLVLPSVCGEGWFFNLTPFCLMAERISHGCMTSIAVRGAVDCGKKCEFSADCLGLLMDGRSKCFLSKPCPAVRGCQQGDDRAWYWKKETPCENGGQWNQQTGTCECSGGWIGTACQRLASHCVDLYRNGYKVGTYLVYMKPADILNPFRINCFSFGATIATVVSKYDARYTTLDYNRTMREYIDGFYDNTNPYTYYWLGLQKIKSLLNYKKARLFKMHIKMHNRSSVTFLNYGFDLGDASEGYPFSVARVRAQTYGNFDFLNKTGEKLYLEDCMSGLQGTKFSTFDADNDLDPLQNCAAHDGGGWWYSSCNNSCNFLASRDQINSKPQVYDNERGWGIHFPNFSSKKVVLNILMYDTLT